MRLFTGVRRFFLAEEDVEMPDNHECLHGTLIARWDNTIGMGDEDKATEWTCSACGERFAPEEAEAVRRRAVERLAG